MKVFKFGGASVKDANAIRNVSTIVKKYQKEELLIVVSAIGKMTNAFEELLNLVWNRQDYTSQLSIVKNDHLDICKNLFSESHIVFDVLGKEFNAIQKHISRRDDWKSYDWAYDHLVSFGELLSTKIVYHYFLQENISSKWLDARELIVTDKTWREGQVNWNNTEENIQQALAETLKTHIGITQGFLGGTEQKETTTLGREGSDFTGGIFAHCLNASSLTIWKDVPGFMNADPKLIPNACLYEQLSYKETAEMSRYGASVVHPKTIAPLAKKNILLWVKSFSNNQAKGTKIHIEGKQQNIPAIIFKKNQVLLAFTPADFGFISASVIDFILQRLADKRLKINMLQTLAMQLSIITNQENRKIQELMQELSTQFHIQETKDITLLTILNYDENTIPETVDASEIVAVQQNQRIYQAALKNKS